nr:MAG TPA: hypothetical protein [Bacteriophage sp.]
MCILPSKGHNSQTHSKLNHTRKDVLFSLNGLVERKTTNRGIIWQPIKIY